MYSEQYSSNTHTHMACGSTSQKNASMTNHIEKPEAPQRMIALLSVTVVISSSLLCYTVSTDYIK